MEEAFGRAGRDEPAALSLGPPDQPVTASLSLYLPACASMGTDENQTAGMPRGVNG